MKRLEFHLVLMRNEEDINVITAALTCWIILNKLLCIMLNQSETGLITSKSSMNQRNAKT